MKKIIGILLLVFVAIACKEKPDYPEDVILKFGNEYLTYQEVTEKIPDGLSSLDSATLFSAIVEGWIKDNVLADFAEERLLDTEEIDRKVKDYRNSLIVEEYLRKMRENKTSQIDEQKVKQYYDLHRKELKLEVPLIKGVFLKINSDSKGKEELRKLLTSEEIEDIDKLEQNWMEKALEYNYFRDKWIDWETVSGLIPYRFGSPEKFLSENKYFETEYEDCAYYLQITDFIPAGEEQPYDFAKTWIRDVLSQGELAEYEIALVNSLVEKSIKDKSLETIGYDPIKHEMKIKLR